VERRTRSLLKSISWRVVATFTTIILVFLFTGNFALSASIGSVEFLMKMGIYYLHERVWNLVDFGREKSR